MNQEKTYGSIEEVAAMLSITPEQVHSLIRRGVLLRDRHFVRHGRVVVFYLPEVRAAMTPEDIKRKAWSPRRQTVSGLPAIPLARQSKITGGY